MSVQCEVTAKQAAGVPMSVFERYLTVWVLLCIVAGIALGQFFPGVFQAIGGMEVAKVNLPVGLLIWVMVTPILMNRPVVVTPLGTRLCRPSEAVLDILPDPQRAAFSKEDGEAVVNAEGKRV